MGSAEGFAWVQRNNGDVVISHHGRTATTRRGRRAKEFIDDDGGAQEQDLMTRLTGNYRPAQRTPSSQSPPQSLSQRPTRLTQSS